MLEEFRERAEGGGQVGALDFAVLCRGGLSIGCVTGYFRAFEAG